MFDHVPGATALLLTGSSHWTRGGLERNVEATASTRLDLRADDDRKLFEEVDHRFRRYRQEMSDPEAEGEGFARRVTRANLGEFTPLPGDATGGGGRSGRRAVAPPEPGYAQAESAFAGGTPVRMPSRRRRPPGPAKNP